MVRSKEELYLTVPSFFKCPISMDVMKSPVSLCTGVTYDRASIQKWLDSGHNTCPATMQVLHSTDVVPNLTLRRLIRVWSDSCLDRPESHVSFSKQQVIQSIRNMIDNESNRSLASIIKIADFAKISEENREVLVSVDGFVDMIVRILSENNEIEVVEAIVAVLDSILSLKGVKERVKKLLFASNRDCLSRFVFVLQRGNLDAKIKSARVLESIGSDAESQRAITEKNGMLNELYLLVSSEKDRNSIDAGLSALIAVCTSRPAKKDLVRFGIVRTAGKLLAETNTAVPVIEKVMKVLEMVSTCTEGRTAICEDENCVEAVMNKVMKVSSAATEHGIGVIWSVCYMSRDRTAQEVAMRSNGLTKVLLVMQSSCGAGVRQMCGDLVKVFRVNSKSCLASYETRTTHIMPY